MPVYSFEDIETGEEFELQMSYDELQEFLANNKQVNQTFRMNIVDPVGIGITKPPADFQKYVLGKVAEAPGASSKALDRRWGKKREW